MLPDMTVPDASSTSSTWLIPLQKRKYEQQGSCSAEGGMKVFDQHKLSPHIRVAIKKVPSMPFKMRKYVYNQARGKRASL